MEKKIKYRILGVLIVVGLIIILLPLFLSEKEDQTPDVAVIKTPPFPDQIVQVNGNNSDVPSQTVPLDLTNADENTIEPNLKSSPSESQSSAPKQTEKPNNELPPNVVNVNNDSKSEQKPLVGPDTQAAAAAKTEDANLKPTSTTNEDKPNQSNVSEALANANDKQAVPTQRNNEANSANVKESAAQNDQVLNDGIDKGRVKHQTKNHTRIKNLAQKLTNEPLNKNGLLDLKKPAWVIQVGSFKNKTNAIRIVNRLRANGFPAFIQHVNSSAFGETIRVFVGPEDKQTNATALAKQMEKDLHVAGIVISYKPLAL